MISLNSNLAAAYLKDKNALKAIECCSKVLSIDENHQKAIYRFYQAKLDLCEFETAIEFLSSKKDILGSFIDFPSEMVKAKKLKIAQDKAEKSLYTRMFSA